MKMISTSKLLLLAVASTMLFSCSVSEDDQVTTNKSVQPEMEQMSQDSMYKEGEGEPMIPKPRG